MFKHFFKLHITKSNPNMGAHLQWLRNTSAIQCGHSKLGIETKTILQTSKLPKGIKFYNLFGTSFDTPFHPWFHFSPTFCW
jgi:hypothetical protein